MSDEDLIRVVKEDLRFLTKEWKQGVDDESIRRASPILRRLLVEGDLQQAWRRSGREGQPKVSAHPLEDTIDNMPIDKILFVSAGGAAQAGAMIAGIRILNFARSPEEIARSAKRVPKFVDMGIVDFSAATCMMINGEKVSRRLVIKYIANKLGGAHYDTSRGSKEENRVFELLDSVKNQKLLGLQAFYFEALAAGQAIVKSPDIQSFIA